LAWIFSANSRTVLPSMSRIGFNSTGTTGAEGAA
jgi:hypothetical protein